MITHNGLSTMLRTFVAPIKDANMITTLQLGLDTSGDIVDGETDPSEFVPVFNHPVSTGDMSIDDYHTLKVVLDLDGKKVLGREDILRFTSIRLLFDNGTVFAWRRFPMRVLGYEFRAAIDWDVILDDMCWNDPRNIMWDNILGKPNSSVDGIDRMVDSAHSHSNKDVLDRFQESGDLPNIDGDGDIVRIFWNGEE